MKRFMLVCLSVLLCLCLFATTVYAISDVLSTEKSFVNNCYDVNGILACKLHTTIKGYFSIIDQWSEVSSISCYLTDKALSGLTVSTSKSGNTAAAYIKYDGRTIGTVRFRISTSGGITQY